MDIVLLSDWGRYKAGQEFWVARSHAEALIKAGIAAPAPQEAIIEVEIIGGKAAPQKRTYKKRKKS